MSDRARLEKAVRDAEAELDAAKTLTAVKTAAKKLQRAKAELKRLESDSPAAARTRGTCRHSSGYPFSFAHSARRNPSIDDPRLCCQHRQ
jgi:hypothetical protein